MVVNRLDLLATLSDSAQIHALIRKARHVSVEKGEFCIFVKTQNKKSWEVRRAKNGDVYCTCLGYRFNKDEPKICKHILAVSAVFSEDEIPLYVHKKNR